MKAFHDESVKVACHSLNKGVVKINAYVMKEPMISVA